MMKLVFDVFNIFARPHIKIATALALATALCCSDCLEFPFYESDYVIVERQIIILIFSMTTVVKRGILYYNVCSRALLIFLDKSFQALVL